MKTMTTTNHAQSNDATPSVFERLAKTLEKQVDALCNLHVLPDLFAGFMQKASPAEIELLMNTLSERWSA
jgi:hypothetical protein